MWMIDDIDIWSYATLEIFEEYFHLMPSIHLMHS
jgi:hypothetical protein